MSDMQCVVCDKETLLYIAGFSGERGSAGTCELYLTL